MMVNRPRGTRDFGPQETAWRRQVAGGMHDVFRRFGYNMVQTPTFEELELFTAKSGEGIISELYDFEDKGGRRMTLRPELTAPVMRMYHADHAFDPKPVKWYYFGNCFRYDRPQAGRYREFWQFGCEVIGAGTPSAYAELIALASECLGSSGLRELDVRVGHVAVLRAAVAAEVPEQRRGEAMRLIDKGAGDELAALLADVDAPHADAIQAIAAGDVPDLEAATGVLEWLPDAADGLAELDAVFAALGDLGVTPRLHLGIARGLDYYSGVVFEIHSPALGAQSQIVGGGGYDLSAVFGAQPVPTIGFGLGFDRTLVALEAQGDQAPETTDVDVYLGALGEAAVGVVARGATKMRRLGMAVDVDLLGRKPNQIAKAADAAGARFLVIVGDRDIEAGTVQAKHLGTGERQEIPIDKFVDWLLENTGGIDLRDYN